MNALKLLFRITLPYILYMLASIIVTTFAYVLFPDLSLSGKIAVLTTGLSALVVLPLFFYFYKQDCAMRQSKFPKLLCIPQGFLPTLLLGIGAFFAGNFLIIALRIDQIFTGYENVSALLFQPSLFTQILFIGIVIPVTEEMIFRILGFRRLRDSISFVKAALISSALFGLFHGNMVQFLYAFGLGYIMCYAYELTGDFKTPILIHMVANICSIVLTNFDFFEMNTLLSVSLFALFGVILTVFSMRYLKKGIVSN